jgi:hypothetical protein
MISSIIFVASSYNLKLIGYLDLPVRLPKLAYYYFYPPTPEDFSPRLTPYKTLLAILLYLANVLLYSIPVYLILSIIRWSRKNKPLIETPPGPPVSFD